MPELVRDTVAKGAELMIRIQGPCACGGERAARRSLPPSHPHPKRPQKTTMPHARTHATGYMHPCSEVQRIIPRVRAIENNCYVAVANLSGRD